MTSCLVSRLSSFATGRAIENSSPWAQDLNKSFAAAGYKLPDLMREVAISDEFFRVSPPETKAAELPNKPAR